MQYLDEDIKISGEQEVWWVVYQHSIFTWSTGQKLRFLKCYTLLLYYLFIYLLSLFISLYLRLEHNVFSLKMGENHNLDLVQALYFGLPEKLISSARDINKDAGRWIQLPTSGLITKVLVASAVLATEMSEKQTNVGFSTFTFRTKRKMPDMLASRNKIFKVKILFLRKSYHPHLKIVLDLETLAVPALGWSRFYIC